MLADSLVDGVIIGMLLGFQNDMPLVVYAGNPQDHAVEARSLARLSVDDVGASVALLFEGGDRSRPLVIGRVLEPAEVRHTPAVVHDGAFVRLTAAERIELRVGKASIIMEKDGHVTIRGTYLVSHASAANRIRGGSVNLN